MVNAITSTALVEVGVYVEQKKYSSQEDAVNCFEKAIDEICADTGLECDVGDISVELVEDGFYYLTNKIDFTINGWCEKIPATFYEPPEYNTEMEADQNSLRSAFQKLEDNYDYDIESLIVFERN